METPTDMRDLIQEFLDKHIEMPYRSEVRRSIEALIESKCKEQRVICAEAWREIDVNQDGVATLTEINRAIQNAPSPTNT